MADDITAKVKLIVADQAKVCTAKTENLERELSQLTLAVKALNEEMVAARIAIAVQKQKVGLWAAVGASLPVIVILVIELWFR